MLAATSSKLVIAVGLPGSGKSTFLPATALSSDRIRQQQFGSENDQTHNGEVFAELRRQATASLAANPITYIDATNLTRRERRPWIDLARNHAAAIEALYFDIPLRICKARNAARSRIVPERILNLMAAKLVPPSLEEGFSRVEVVAPLRETLPPASAN